MAPQKDLAHWMELLERSTESPEAPEASARTWVTAAILLGLVVPLAAYLAWVLYWKPRREAARPGDPSTMDLVGETGVAATDLDPEGLCRVLGRDWPCRAGQNRNIPVGAPVLVVGWEANRYVVDSKTDDSRS